MHGIARARFRVLWNLICMQIRSAQRRRHPAWPGTIQRWSLLFFPDANRLPIFEHAAPCRLFAETGDVTGENFSAHVEGATMY